MNGDQLRDAADGLEQLDSLREVAEAVLGLAAIPDEAAQVAARPRQSDHIFEFDGVRVFVDPKSFVHLQRMVVDYENTLMRQGFIFKNPNASRSCGCGSSFA